MAVESMKFYTVAFDRRIQSDGDFTHKDWAAVVESYRAHLTSIFTRLPHSVRALSRVDFHDCSLHRIDFVAPDTVTIWFEGFKNYADRRRKSIPGMHRVTFKKVSDTNLSLAHLSQTWLWDEIDWTENRSELRILLHNYKRFFVRFHSVQIHTTAYPASWHSLSNPKKYRPVILLQRGKTRT